MNSIERLERLEQLARLRDTGALSQVEFEREKGLLLGTGRAASEDLHAGVDSTEALVGPANNRRWSVWIAVGLALAGGSGWAFADWAKGMSRPGPAMQADAAATSAAALPVPSSSAASSVIRAMPPERQLDLAFDAVFGQGERQVRAGNDAVYNYAKGKLFWADFGPILILEGSGEPYPSAIGTLGIFYLREVEGAKFKVTRRWPDAATGSMMGNPPQWKIRSDIARGLVIEAKSGGVWQGYACDLTSLIELTPEGPSDLVSFDLQYDSTGAVGDGGESYDGAIVNVVPGRSFDVRFSGSKPVTQHFVRKGAKFIRVPGENGTSGADAIPTC